VDLTAALRHSGVLDRDETADLTPLRGGYHNDVSLLRSKHGRFVAKHFVAGSTNPLFPQLPRAEFAALTILRGLGVAPQPIALVPAVESRDLLVYEFVEGVAWRSDGETDGDAAAIGALFAAVHSIDGSAATAAGLRALPMHPVEVLAQAATLFHAAGHQACTTAPTPAAETFAPTLVHTDCGPGNIIVGPDSSGRQRPVLIDWQCPGVGDPVEDLANFTSPAIQILYGLPPLGDADIAAFLDAYAATCMTDATVERFHRLRGPYHLRLAAYCAYRRHELRASNPEVAALYDIALRAERSLLESLR